MEMETRALDRRRRTSACEVREARERWRDICGSARAEGCNKSRQNESGSFSEEEVGKGIEDEGNVVVLIPGHCDDEIEELVLIHDALTLAREIVQVGGDFGAFLGLERDNDDLDVDPEIFVVASAMTPR